MSFGTSGTGVGSPDSEPSGTTQVEYPVQRHAGKVGLGPNFNTGSGIGDKVTGIVEEIKGKFTHNPELVRHGHDTYTGERKRQEILGGGKDPVFQSGQDADKKRAPAGPPSATTTSGAQRNVREPTINTVYRGGKEAAPAATDMSTVPTPMAGKSHERVKSH